MIADNNIFNIRYNKRNKWLGQIGSKRGFVCFDTKEHAIRAAFVLLVNYIRSGYDTRRKIINRFAPLSENDTNKYLDFVCTSEFDFLPNLDPDKELSLYAELFQLMSRMAKFENGLDLSISDIRKAVCNETDIYDYSKIKM